MKIPLQKAVNNFYENNIYNTENSSAVSVSQCFGQPPQKYVSVIIERPANNHFLRANARPPASALYRASSYNVSYCTSMCYIKSVTGPIEAKQLSRYPPWWGYRSGKIPVPLA